MSAWLLGMVIVGVIAFSAWTLWQDATAVKVELIKADWACTASKTEWIPQTIYTGSTATVVMQPITSCTRYDHK